MASPAWMVLRRGEGNERTRRNDRINIGNQAREMERSRGKEMILAIQDKIDGLRQAVQQVIDRVRGPDRGPDRGWSR